jgi:5-methylcytosine-specific restriction endonuclease McrA
MTTTAAGQRDYNLYTHSPRWRAIRFIRRRLDDNRCRVCFATQHLQTHHRTYRNRGRAGPMGMIAEIRDCVTLCAECHEQAHRQGRIRHD